MLKMRKLSIILILFCGDFNFLSFSLPQHSSPSVDLSDNIQHDPVVGRFPPSETEVTDTDVEIVPHDAEILSTYKTAAVRDFIYENRNVKWASYFSLHSYGQKWMSPWGFTDVKPIDYDELMRVAEIGALSIATRRGMKYDTGSAPEILYMASGGSDDWFKGAVGCKYSYTIELPDFGLWGFLLPSWEIIPTANETWYGMATALRSIARTRAY